MYGEHRPVRLRASAAAAAVQDHELHGEHRRVGRRRAVHHRQPDGACRTSSRSAGARHAHPVGEVPADRRRHRPGRQRRHVRGAERRGARGARRGHAHGVPATGVVRREAHRPGLHRCVVDAREQHDQVRPRRTSRTSGTCPGTWARTRRRHSSQSRIQHKTTVVTPIMADEASEYGLDLGVAHLPDRGDGRHPDRAASSTACPTAASWARC